MKSIVFILCSFVSFAFYAQDEVVLKKFDNRYLEDQFYLGLTYNFLLQKPEDVNQSNLSYGIQGGLIKDIPLNGRRNVALGLGLGYAFYSYYSNLRVTEGVEDYGYSVIEDNDDFKRSKIETHMIELPLEFRWRTSTAESYKFWRLYAGFKLGYVVGGRSKYVPSEGSKESFYNKDIRPFHYGLTLNFGFNTFNLQAYYALNNLMDDNVLFDGSEIKWVPLRLGLIFYIL